MLRHVRYAVRRLSRRPLFTAAVVSMLALGVGVNVAVFSLINAMLIRPLPYDEPGRLVAVNSRQEARGIDWGPVSVPTFLDWEASARGFSALGAYERRSFDSSAEERPERLPGCAVSVDLFSLLGVQPAVGRSFQPGEGNGARVVLIGHRLWRSHFHADPAVLGRMLRLDGQPYEIVGVMPKGFGFPEQAELWTPLSLVPGRFSRDDRRLEVLGRLRPEVSPQEAQHEMDALAGRLAKRYPETDAGRGVRVRPLREALIPRGPRVGMYLMLAAVSCVLLIVASNIGTLMRVQSIGRSAETALRTALGASRRRLISELLTESLALAVAGGGLGTLLSLGLNRAMTAAVPVQIPFWIHFDLDGRVLLFGLVVSLMSAFVFGLGPAIRASRPDQFGTLRDGGARTTRQASFRLHRGAVVLALSLSMVLLVSAMLLVKSFFHLQGANPGYTTDGVLTVRLSLTAEEHSAPASRAQLLDEIVRKVAELPAVQSAAAVEFLPLSRDGYVSTPVVAEDRRVPQGDEPIAIYDAVTRGYFQTLEIPVVRGRDFTALEVERSASVAVINASLAEQLWPGEDPIGKHLRTVQTTPGEWSTVVGVAGDVDTSYQLAGLDAWPKAQVYVPSAQSASPNMTLVIRTPLDPLGLVQPVRDRVSAIAPNLPLYHVLTLQEVLGQVLWLPRFWGQMFSAFGAFAMLIATLGIYGVTAHSLSQRRREMGIRMALGANGPSLLKMVLLQTLRIAVVGLGVGLVAALGTTRALGAILYGVSTRDAAVFATVLGLLGITTLVATYLPARRVTRVNPADVLRN